MAINKMNPVILYRNSLNDYDELNTAQQYFSLTDSRNAIKHNSFVIPRYSALPFYKELEVDINNINSKLINSYSQFIYIADLINYYNDLHEFTPKTYTSLENLPDNTSFVLKGETNSKKFDWVNSMFAKDKKDAVNVYLNLQNDSLISTQKIYIREYLKLKQVSNSVSYNCVPISKEYRFFVAYKNIISGGFYWSTYIDDLFDKNDIDIRNVPQNFLQKIIDIIGDKNNFYTIDVAQTEDGEWILVELNSGEMSGLSCNNPIILYPNLKKVIDANI